LNIILFLALSFFPLYQLIFFLARDFAHLARPQVRDEHRRIVIRRASSTGREHSQGAKLPLKYKTNPISERPKMNATKVLTVDYENKRLFRRAENKPKQTQFHAQSKRTNP
jgi:hypothetical protein